MIDDLSCEGIKNALSEALRDSIRVEVLSKTDSTNTVVKRRASCGDDEGLFVVAGEQSQGRGRLGRSFFSPDDTGLYMSLLLRPSITPEQSVLITTAAAVSVCDALKKVGAEDTAIKWVNDVFFNDKKVCGILTEASFNPTKGALDYVVLGVGVNVYEPKNGFPSELQSIAGAVFEGRADNLRNTIAAEFLNAFMVYYKELDKKTYLARYAEKCFVIGKDINVIANGECTPAKAVDLDGNCGLLVEFDDGEKALLNSGEISIRIKS